MSDELLQQILDELKLIRESLESISGETSGLALTNGGILDELALQSGQLEQIDNSLREISNNTGSD